MKHKKTLKKIAGLMSVIRFAAVAVTVGAAIYSLIPRDDKITGIDENELIKAFLPKEA